MKHKKKYSALKYSAPKHPNIQKKYSAPKQSNLLTLTVNSTPKYPKKPPQILTFFVKLTAQSHRQREKNEQSMPSSHQEAEEQNRQREDRAPTSPRTEETERRQSTSIEPSTSTEMAENQPQVQTFDRQTWPTKKKKKKKGRKEEKKRPEAYL